MAAQLHRLSLLTHYFFTKASQRVTRARERVEIVTTAPEIRKLRWKYTSFKNCSSRRIIFPEFIAASCLKRVEKRGGGVQSVLGCMIGNTSVTTLFMSGIVHFGHGLYMLVTTLPCRGVCVQIRRERLG